VDLVETVSLWEGGAERNGARCSGWCEGRGGETERKKRAESAVSIRVDGATERLVKGGGIPPNSGKEFEEHRKFGYTRRRDRSPEESPVGKPSRNKVNLTKHPRHSRVKRYGSLNVNLCRGPPLPSADLPGLRIVPSPGALQRPAQQSQIPGVRRG